MENLYLSFSVIFPICVYLTLGYIMKRMNVLDDSTVKKMNNTIFKVFLPVLLFCNVYQADIESALNPKLCIYGALSVVIVFLVSLIIIPRIEKDDKKISVIIQGIFRSNFVIFGLPVVTSLYGAENTGVTAVLIAVITPLFNSFAVIVLEIFRGGKIDVKHLLKGIITNPLIISSILGIISIVTGFKMPALIEKCVFDMSKVATPLALVLLGATFTFGSVKGYKKQIAIGILGKLVIVPLIFLSIGVYLGFRNVELASLIALFASPAAVSSFVMAEKMGGDSTLAGQYIVLGSVCSIFTVFVFVFVLKQLGMI